MRVRTAPLSVGTAEVTRGRPAGGDPDVEALVYVAGQVLGAGEGLGSPARIPVERPTPAPRTAEVLTVAADLAAHLIEKADHGTRRTALLVTHPPKGSS
ncbi:hypothetical protein [Streptosporangium sp. LJ11]|uniref:hypothetical protein n=1 Tax=Streptosporangium sp. LJ11 TaxID=3436927 RepID=UPI003F792320